MSNLNENLKELMEAAAVNAATLSENTHIDLSTIYTFLRGDGLPNFHSLIVLADYFQCPADFLLGRIEHWKPRQFKKAPPFSEQLSFLLDYFHVTKYRLEKKSRLSEKTVNRWHSGITQPNIESLIRLAEYFACSVDFIIGRER